MRLIEYLKTKYLVHDSFETYGELIDYMYENRYLIFSQEASFRFMLVKREYVFADRYFALRHNGVIKFQKLWKKLLIFTKKSYDLKVIKPPFRLVQSPEIPIGVAWKSKTYSIPLVESLGKISGDIICPYPPGIPLIVPGERIDKERIDWIEAQSLYNEDLLNSYIRVLNN